ncbi:uncharacterized protein [Malus domestica]|uniref:uncharacterized protein n=1 Tax=Malus domestica TaxID=3750 RepID=UPI00397536D5
MTHLLWNCRGLGSDTVVRALRGLIRKHRPTMIFLSETKMKDHRLDGIRRRLGYSNGFHVPPVGRAGGLSLWWQDTLRVIVLFSSKHVIDVCYYLEEVSSWVRGTFVYGTSYRAEKVEFWNWLQNSFGPTDIPWLCGGDFNEFMWDSEKSGGTSVLYNIPAFLSNFLFAAELMDLGFIGPKFTWRGIRAGQLIEERLDRAAFNVRWQDLWPNSVVIHETAIGSDHWPVVVQSKPPFRKGKRPFRFEAFWAKEADCRDVVQKSWSLQGKDNWLDSWHHKLSVCKSSLINWSKYSLINWSRNKFKKRGLEIEALVNHLDSLQLNWADNLEEIKAITNRVDQLREQEEMYWLQRSRVKWL